MRGQAYYQKRAREILDSIKYLTLATVSKEGLPWNSPLAHSVADNFNLYFGSPKDTQHAKNIRDNGKGFVVIYDSTAPDGEGEGVYMTAKVRELSDGAEIQDAIKVMFKSGNYKVENFTGESGFRIYLIEPGTMWMNDAEEKDGLYYDFRVEIKL